MNDDLRLALDFVGSPVGGAAAGIISVVFFDVSYAVAGGIALFVPLVALGIRHG